MTQNPVPASGLAQLGQAEAALADAIRQTARRLDAVGTNTVDAALAELQASADAARARLTAAFGKVQSVAGEVAAHVAALASLLAGQVEQGLAATQPAARSTIESNATETTGAPPIPAAPPAEPVAGEGGIDLGEDLARQPDATAPSDPASRPTPQEQMRQELARIAALPPREPHPDSFPLTALQAVERGLLTAEQVEGAAAAVERLGAACANPPGASAGDVAGGASPTARNRRRRRTRKDG